MTTHAEPGAAPPPTPQPAPQLQVRGPLDLAHLVPYLLGFHPRQSLVLVGLDRARVVVTARVDLDDAWPPVAADGDGGANVVEHTVATLSRGGCSSFVGLIYDDAPVAGPRHPPGTVRAAGLGWAGLAELVAVEVAACGAGLQELALVSHGRLWSLACTDALCCPPEGRALDPASAVAAEATYAGLVALPDRDSLEAVLAPDADRRLLADRLSRAESAAAGLDTDQVGRDDRAVKRRIFAAARAADAGTGDLDVSTTVRIGAALRRRDLLDAVWTAIDHRRLDGRPLWQQLARRLPAPWDAPALFLFGWASYRRGDGALAGMAAERALASDPSYSCADLLLAAVGNGVDPRRLPRLRRPTPRGGRRR